MADTSIIAAKLPRKDLWSSPEYSFRVPVPSDPTKTQLHEVVIDVTLSAPPFDEPSAPLKKVLQSFMRDFAPAGAKVLDFGAGKLRNALYLLQRGIRVCGVEFQKLAQTPHGAKAYGKATDKYPHYWTLVYPHAFFEDNSQFNAVLLINVLNVMPVSPERMVVLQECYKKLRLDGHVLWYSQYGDTYYKAQCTDDVRLGDGYYLGKTRRYKTFYREFSDGEMDGMMSSSGFEFVKSYAVPHNHVRVYKKTAANPLAGLVTMKDLRREVPRDASIPAPKTKTPRVVTRSRRLQEVRPDPPALALESQYIARLGKLRPGNADAPKYHALILGILKHLYVPSRLVRLKKEAEIYEGRKRVDILCRTGKEGFFASLNDEYGILSPYVFVECKNYSTDPKNPEFDQLMGRLGTKKGRFGLLVCRTIADRSEVIAQCKNIGGHGDGKMCGIVLEDSDIVKLLEFRQAGNPAGMDEYLDERLGEVLE